MMRFNAIDPVLSERGHFVKFADHAREVALLRGQLAARDAALDAILQLVPEYPFSILAGELSRLLTAHGIHPK